MLSYEGNLSPDIRRLIDKEYNDMSLFTAAANRLTITVMAQGKGKYPDYIFKKSLNSNIYYFISGIGDSMVKGSLTDIVKYIRHIYASQPMKRKWGLEIANYIKREAIENRIIFNGNFADSRIGNELIVHVKYAEHAVAYSECDLSKSSMIPDELYNESTNVKVKGS